MNEAVAKLPAPHQDNENIPVLETFIEPLQNSMKLVSLSSKEVLTQIIEDVTARSQEGLKKYGVMLKPHNGRNALVDLYQELLDANLYLTQHIAELGDALSDDEHGYLDSVSAGLMKATVATRHHLNEQQKETE